MEKVGENLNGIYDEIVDEVAVLDYEIDFLNSSEGLSGVFFNLPVETPSDYDPFLVVYGENDFGGVVFSDSSFYRDTVFGIESQLEKEKVMYDMNQCEFSPFQEDRQASNKVINYEMPLTGEKKFLVTANIYQDKSQDSLVLQAFNRQEKILDLLIGRKDDGWAYLARE